MPQAQEAAGRALRGLKMSQLRLMAELAATGQLTLAAERMGLTQPAASRMLAQIEAAIGHPVRERVGRSLRLTAAGEALARRAQRVQLELADAARDIAEAAAGNEGQVRVGSVTGPALSHLLPVLRKVRKDAPGVSVDVVVATSDVLCDHVLGGRLDFALGRIPAALEGQLALHPMGQEPLSLVVRRGHPLLARPGVRLDDLLAHDWVMSEEETLLSKTVLRWFANHGCAPPRRWVSTSSFLFTLALLKESDAVAPLAKPVVDSFTGGVSMPFVPVPFDMALSVEAYGLFRRRGATLPPASDRVARMILDMAGTL